MATLQTADGRLLASAPPRGSGLSTLGLAGLGVGGPVWSAGSQGDAFRPDTDVPWGNALGFDVIYRTQPVVAAVVNKLVRQIATLPLKVYRVDVKGNHVRVRAEDASAGGSLARLLEAPSPRRAGVHLKQWISHPALLYGNALLAKYRQARDEPPTELIPMDWRYVNAYAQPGGAVEVWETTQLGSPRYVVADETMHFAWEASDGPLGVSPLEQLRNVIRLQDAMQRYLTSSFRNGARPSALVTLPQGTNISRDKLQEFRRDLEAMHKGVDQAFKVGLLAPGADIKPLGWNAVDMQVMDAMKWSRDEVCMVYDLKPGQIGDLSTPGAGYGSVVEVNRDLYRTTLRPWLTMIEETVKAQLIDPEPAWQGLYVEFDMGEVLKGEPEAVATQIQTEVSSGTMTPNEGRRLQNRPYSDEPDADKLYLPQNNLKPLGAPPDPPAPPPGPRVVQIQRDAQGRAQTLTEGPTNG